MDNSYIIATRYEHFIRKVFNCDVNKHGAHLSTMQNVMFMEEGRSYSKHLGSLDKQFAKVRTYIDRAILKLIKDSNNEDEKSFYEGLLLELEDSTNTRDLMNVVELAFNKLISGERL